MSSVIDNLVTRDIRFLTLGFNANVHMLENFKAIGSLLLKKGQMIHDNLEVRENCMEVWIGGCVNNHTGFQFTQTTI